MCLSRCAQKGEVQLVDDVDVPVHIAEQTLGLRTQQTRSLPVLDLLAVDVLGRRIQVELSNRFHDGVEVPVEAPKAYHSPPTREGGPAPLRHQGWGR